MALTQPNEFDLKKFFKLRKKQDLKKLLEDNRKARQTLRKTLESEHKCQLRLVCDDCDGSGECLKKEETNNG